jgi:hypothetical protein
MGGVIADVLEVEVSAVNVKASTGNLGGPEGAGRSISASAIAWLIPAAGAATLRSAAGAPGAAAAGSAVEGSAAALDPGDRA